MRRSLPIRRETLNQILANKWAKLTDDDATQIDGLEDMLLEALQKRYGYTKDKTEKEYEKFIVRYRESRPAKKS